MLMLGKSPDPPGYRKYWDGPGSLGRIYVLTASIVYLANLKIRAHILNDAYFEAERVQTAFLLVLLYSAAFLALANQRQKAGTHLISVMILALGVFLRISYTLFTDAGTRTYDVYRDEWGHLDYIRYIARYLALPPVNECQTYHPPVHHILSAASWNLSRLFTGSEQAALKFVQLVMVLVGSLTLVLFHKILKALACGGKATLFALSVFAFHPSNLYFSSRINNDNTLLFFYTLSFYLLLRWLNSGRTRDILFLSLAASCTALTKFSGFLLAPLILTAFAAAYWKKRNDSLVLLRQITVFSALYVPLSFSYQIRNYVLFQQPFGYVPYLSKGYTPTFFNLTRLSVPDLLSRPFNKGGLHGGENFPEFFLRSSLFGEWEFPGLEWIAVPLLLAAAVLILLLLFHILSLGKKLFQNYRYVFLLNLILPILAEMKFRTDFPIACSQDFRYAAPLLLSAAFFLGEAAERPVRRRSGSISIPVSACILLFCILSSGFILLLGSQ